MMNVTLPWVTKTTKKKITAGSLASGPYMCVAESRGVEKWFSTRCCCIHALLSKWYIRVSHQRGCWVRNGSIRVGWTQCRLKLLQPPQNKTQFTDETTPSSKKASFNLSVLSLRENEEKRTFIIKQATSPLVKSTWWAVWRTRCTCDLQVQSKPNQAAPPPDLPL